MSENQYYYVYPTKAFIDSCEKLKPLLSKNEGFFSCTSVKHDLQHYLEIEVPYHDPSQKEKALALYIPHNHILYVLELHEKGSEKALGFGL